MLFSSTNTGDGPILMAEMGSLANFTLRMNLNLSKLLHLGRKLLKLVKL